MQLGNFILDTYIVLITPLNLTTYYITYLTSDTLSLMLKF